MGLFDDIELNEEQKTRPGLFDDIELNNEEQKTRPGLFDDIELKRQPPHGQLESIETGLLQNVPHEKIQLPTVPTKSDPFTQTVAGFTEGLIGMPHPDLEETPEGFAENVGSFLGRGLGEVAGFLPFARGVKVGSALLKGGRGLKALEGFSNIPTLGRRALQSGAAEALFQTTKGVPQIITDDKKPSEVLANILMGSVVVGGGDIVLRSIGSQLAKRGIKLTTVLDKFKGFIGKGKAPVEALELSVRDTGLDPDIIAKEAIDDINPFKSSVNEIDDTVEAIVMRNATADDISTVGKNIADGVEAVPKKIKGLNIGAITSAEDAQRVIAKVAEQLPDPKVETLEQLEEQAMRVGFELSDIPKLGSSVKEAGRKLSALEAVLSKKAVDVANIVKKMGEGKKDKELTQQLADELYQVDTLVRTSRETRGEFGREFRGLKTDAQVKKARQDILNKLQKNMVDNKGQVSDDLIKAVNSINFNNPTELVSLSKELIDPTFGQRLKTFWISSILSGLKTQGVNITGNGLFAPIRYGEKLISGTIQDVTHALIDATGRKGFTQDRFAREAIASFEGLRQGITLGGRGLLRALKEGKPTFERVSKLDVPGLGQTTPRIISSFGSGKLVKGADVVLTAPLRSLFAVDDFFKTFSFETNSRSLALREAMIRGQKKQWTHNQVQEFAEDILLNKENPLFGKVQAAAFRRAREDVFQEDIGRIGNGVMALRGALPGGIGEFLIPFVRTPVNLAKNGLQRTPLQVFNVLNTVRKVRTGEKAVGDLTDEMSKLATASVITYLTYEAVDRGILTGSRGDRTRNEQNVDRIQNRPYSFNIGDRNIEYGRLDPLAIPMGFMADIFEAHKEGKNLMSPDVFFGTAFMSIANNLSNKTFVKNLADTISIFTEGGFNQQASVRVAQRVSGNIASGFIPFSGLISQILRSDNPERTKAKDLTELIKRKFGFNEVQMKVHNIYGEPILDMLDTSENLVRRMTNAVAPLRVTEDDISEESAEIFRLGATARMGPLQDAIKNMPLTSQEYNQINSNMARVARPALRALMFGEREGLDELTVILRAGRSISFTDARTEARTMIYKYKVGPDFSLNPRFNESKVDLISKVVSQYRKHAYSSMEGNVMQRLLDEGFTRREILLIRQGKIQIEDYRK